MMNSILQFLSMLQKICQNRRSYQIREVRDGGTQRRDSH